LKNPVCLIHRCFLLYLTMLYQMYTLPSTYWISSYEWLTGDAEWRKKNFPSTERNMT
jgi:hypothetical protein